MNQQFKARTGYVSRPCLRKTKVVKDLRKLRNSKEEKKGKKETKLRLHKTKI